MGRTYWPPLTRHLFRWRDAPPDPSHPASAALQPTARRGRGTGGSAAILPGMHLQLAYSDAYARSAEGRVVAVQPGEGDHGPLVVLDRTVFYPGGGGQPADRGTLLRSDDGR